MASKVGSVSRDGRCYKNEHHLCQRDGRASPKTEREVAAATCGGRAQRNAAGIAINMGAGYTRIVTSESPL